MKKRTIQLKIHSKKQRKKVLTCIDANLSGADLGECGNLNSASDVLIVGNIGSRNGYTTIFHTDKGLFVQCGCFKGSLDKFVAKVKETHEDNQHAKVYLAMVEFAKVKFGVDETKSE